MKKVFLPRFFALGYLLFGMVCFAMAQTYCTPSATNACTTNSGNETISNFTLGAINNNSACSPTNYEDFSSPTTYPAIVTTLASPSSNIPYSVTMLHADLSSPYAIVIWIDLDGDGTFAANEIVAQRAFATDCSLLCNNVVKSGTLNIPAGVSAGTKRLRVRAIYNGNAIDPCANINYGEAEDYRVIMTGSVPVTDITVGTVTSLSYCAGDAISVPYTISGTFTSGNIYTAQLSDAAGSFATPVSLGTLSSTATGAVSGTIPSNTAYGTGYKIRIISSNPADTSSNNSVSITVNDKKPVSVSISANPSGSICSGSNVTFTATPVNGGAGPTYVWKVNGNVVGGSSATFASTTLNDNDMVECVLTSNAVCATGSPATATALTMSVGSAFNAGTVSAQSNAICMGTQANLSVTGNSGPIQWQSSIDGTNFSNVTGATDTTYNASPIITTYYQVYGGSGNCIGSSNILQLVVNPLPTAPVITTGDSLICSSDSTEVCVTGGTFDTYLWNNGGTNSCSYAKFAGAVWVNVTDANGCGAQSNRINISIHSVSSVSIIRQGDTLTSFGAVTYQWIKNGADIPGANTPFYVAKDPGDYAVRITDANGCASTSASVNITVGINEVNFNKDIYVFPNPASGFINVQYTGNQTLRCQLKMYNVVGESVKEEFVTFHGKRTEVVDIHGLSSGVYLMQLESGQNKISRKIIVE
ncbi:MAG: T9SS type A sorting domain-containing protein [Bacteroidetes bacterium]|nr:T9SS type A sorting domain-containing protein [Bacteroidota bacterium]